MSTRLTRLVRDPESTDGAVPLLILLHGLGSDERDLMALAPELHARLRVITLRAPHRWTHGGNAWFDLTWDEAGIHIDPTQVLKSLDLLVSEVEQLRQEIKPDRLILGGFSQGAVMTLGVALLRPDLLSAAMLLSGRNVPELFAAASPEAAKLPFLVQHGTYDPVLDVANARTMRDALERLGADVEYGEYPMGHEVSLRSLQDARRWLDRQTIP